MKKQSTLFTFVFTAFLFGCAVGPPTLLERLVTSASTDQWQVGFQRDFGPGDGYIREFVPKGESINSWSKLLSIEFMEGVSSTPTQWTKNFAEKRITQCPNTDYSVIESDSHNIYYSFSFPACMGHEKQSEISRVIAGNDGLHRLSFSVKGRELTPEEKNVWLNFLRDAYVAKGNAKVR